MNLSASRMCACARVVSGPAYCLGFVAEYVTCETHRRKTIETIYSDVHLLFNIFAFL